MAKIQQPTYHSQHTMDDDGNPQVKALTSRVVGVAPVTNYFIRTETGGVTSDMIVSVGPPGADGLPVILLAVKPEEMQNARVLGGTPELDRLRKDILKKVRNPDSAAPENEVPSEVVNSLVGDSES